MRDINLTIGDVLDFLSAEQTRDRNLPPHMQGDSTAAVTIARRVEDGRLHEFLKNSGRLTAEAPAEAPAEEKPAKKKSASKKKSKR